MIKMSHGLKGRSSEKHSQKDRNTEPMRDMNQSLKKKSLDMQTWVFESGGGEFT
jgi:hypothetical protein